MNPLPTIRQFIRQFIRGVCTPRAADLAMDGQLQAPRQTRADLHLTIDTQELRIADLERQLEYLKANHNDWMHEREVFASERAKAVDLERQLAERDSQIKAVLERRRLSELESARSEDGLLQQLTSEREAHAKQLAEIAAAYDDCSSAYLERAEKAESERDSLRAQLDAVTRCCGQQMNYSPSPSNGKPFWFCPECGKELRPDYPYAGEMKDEEHLTNEQIEAAFEEGRAAAEAIVPSTPKGHYR